MKIDIPSRPLTLSEQKQARELWSLAFPDDSEAFKDWFFAHQFPLLRSWSIWGGNKLLTVVYAMPYKLVCRGKSVQTSFILGVATHPDARRCGLMRRLLREVHDDLMQTCPAVCLYPFDFGFYRKLGYSTVSERLRVRLPVGVLTDKPFGVIEASPDFTQLAAINRRHTESMGFFAARDAALLARRFYDLQTGGGFCIMNGQAYAFVDPGLTSEKPDTAESDRRFLLAEFSYSDLEAGQALLSALAESSRVTLLDFSLPLGDASPQWAPSAITQEPFLMLNCLDIPGFVSGMCAESSSLSFSDACTVHILDDDACWRMAIDNGKVSLSAVSAQGDVQLTRDQFIRWVCGRCDTEDLEAEGVRNSECLRFFPKLSAFFFDMY